MAKDPKPVTFFRGTKLMQEKRTLLHLGGPRYLWLYLGSVPVRRQLIHKGRKP